jgi:hypothetical protein
VAGVRLIFKYQWKAYWRRFMQAGQLSQFDILLLLLVGALFIFKLPPVLLLATRELAAGQTGRTERLLLALGVAWLYPLIEDSLISLRPKNLIRFPLTFNSLLRIRICSFFISPVAMIITAGSLLGAASLLASPRPLTGVGTALLFFVTAACLGLSLSHLMSSAALRRRLMAAAAVVIVPLGAALFAGGMDAKRRLGALISFTPVHLVTGAAVEPDYWTVLISLTTLIACAALALLLLRWSFSRSLSDQEVNRLPTNRAARRFRVPGRLGGLVRKEQSYFRKQPAAWFGLLLAVAYSQIFWLGAPPPGSYQVVILIVFAMNLEVSANGFGLDTPSEIDRYLLFPLRGREILLGKNLGFAIVVAAQLSLTLPLAFWRLGWREASFGLIEAAALSLAHFAWGNLASVVAPFKMRFFRFASGGSLIVGITGLVFCSLPGVVIIYLTRFNSEFLAAKLAAVLSLMALTYFGSLQFAGRKFERDWRKISHRLS